MPPAARAAQCARPSDRFAIARYCYCRPYRRRGDIVAIVICRSIDIQSLVSETVFGVTRSLGVVPG